MGRLRADTLLRVEEYSDRVLDVAAALEVKRRWPRIIDQLVGSGGSVGANAFEADQAMSAKDFMKCLGTVLKELNETNVLASAGHSSGMDHSETARSAA